MNDEWRHLPSLGGPADADQYVFGEVHADGPGPGGHWEVISEWRVVGASVEPVEVRLRPYPTRAVLADEVRRLPLGTVLADSRRSLTKMAGQIREMHALASSVPDVPDGFTASGPQRGRRLGADDLAVVAAVYREAHMWGRPVNEAVREKFGGGLSRSGAAKRIMAARRAGLLDDIEPKRGGTVR